MTKREVLIAIGTIAETLPADAPKDDILTYVEKELAAIDRKNEKAREKSAEKATAPDVIAEKFFDLLDTETPMTVNDILAAVGDKTFTPAKVVARMNKLVKADRVVKTKVKNEDKGTVVAYMKA